jgi:hypothetical protein
MNEAKIAADRKFLIELVDELVERDDEYHEAGPTMDRVRRLLDIDGELASDHACLMWAYELLKEYAERQK